MHKIIRISHEKVNARIMNQTGPFCKFLLLVLALGTLLIGCKEKPKPSQLNHLTIDTQSIVIDQSEEGAKAGRSIFLRHCMQCHLGTGTGGVGADLTDDQWVIGGTPQDIVNVIAAGTTNGMPGWSGVLSAEEIGQVAGWVLSNHPSNQTSAVEN